MAYLAYDINNDIFISIPTLRRRLALLNSVEEANDLYIPYDINADIIGKFYFENGRVKYTSAPRKLKQLEQQQEQQLLNEMIKEEEAFDELIKLAEDEEDKQILEAIFNEEEAKAIDEFIQIKQNEKEIKTEQIKDGVKMLIPDEIRTNEDGDIERINYIEDIRNLLKIYKGKRVRATYILDLTLDETIKKFGNPSPNWKEEDGRTIVFDITLDIKNNFSAWWKNNSVKFWVNSTQFVIPFYKYLGKFYVISEEDITPEDIAQSFLDGLNSHCIISPIKNWANECLNDAKSESSKKKYRARLNKLTDYEQRFKDGIDKDGIYELANDIQVDINIRCPFDKIKNESILNVESIKKPLKNFYYINNRFNHAEHTKNVNSILNTNEYEYVETNSKLDDIFRECKKNKENPIYKRNNNGVSVLYTKDKTYKVKDILSEVVVKWEFNSGINEVKVDTIKNRDLTDFIKRGLHMNQTADFPCLDAFRNIIDKQHKLINLYDMTKAYTQHSSNKWYSGFLGKITDFRKTNKIVNVGYYEICNLDWSNANPKLVKINEIMEIYFNFNIYPSCELEMLTSFGVKFDIISGCWGVQPFHFEFNEDMKKDYNGIKGYAKWAGLNHIGSADCAYDDEELREGEYSTFYIQGDKRLAKIYKKRYGKNLKYFPNGEISIDYPSQSNFKAWNILGFVYAYQRLSVIEQLLNIELGLVLRVAVDGIYTLEKDIKLANVFRCKTDEIKEKSKDVIANLKQERSEYAINLRKHIRSSEFEDLPEFREHHSKELFLGPGGCGKTHLNLVDKGLINVLYVSPSWKLARRKHNEYNIDSSVWARVITSDPEIISKITRKYSVLVFDEVSMMTNNFKKCAFERFKNLKLIFCGDVGYQLPPIDKEAIIDFDGFNNIVKLSENKRCKCPKLKKVLQYLRDMIDLGNSKEEMVNFIFSVFRKINHVITEEDAIKMYNINDTFISGMNVTRKDITEELEGTFEIEKWYVLERNKDYSKGDIIYSKEKPKANCEARHCFTTHSYQGETAENKLFIVLDKILDRTHIYTAISRAQYLEQIFISQHWDRIYY